MNFILLYLYRFSGDFIPIVPLLGILYTEKNLTLSTISTIFLTLAITVFVLEIPTGILADRISTKHVLILSRICKLFAFGIILIYPNYFGFIIGAILWGTSSALDSGTFQSYLFSLLHQRFNSSEFEKIYSRSMTASMVGLLVSALIASQITLLNFDIVQIIGVFSLLVSFICILLLPSTHLETAVDKNHPSILSTFSIALSYIRNIPALAILITIGIAAGGVKGSLDEYTSLLFLDKEATLMFIGYALLVIEIAKTFGAFIAGWVRVSTRNQSLLLVFFGILFIIAGAIRSFILVVMTIISVIILDAILWIHNDSAIQRLANNTNRATLASFKNFGTEITAASIFLLVWLTNNSFSVSELYMILGTLLTIIALVLTWKQRVLKS